MLTVMRSGKDMKDDMKLYKSLFIVSHDGKFGDLVS